MSRNSGIRTETLLTDLPCFALRQTWSSLIDSDALNAIPEKERKRQEAIFELILVSQASKQPNPRYGGVYCLIDLRALRQTESAYVQNLQQLVNVFFSQLAPHLSGASNFVF